MKHNITSRLDAAARNQQFYYTGKPCKNNHDSQRYVRTGHCVECQRGHSKDVASATRRHYNSKVQGLFTYPSHPDDHAALLAYAQSLDMDRGRLPHVPAAVQPLHLATPEELQANRQQIFSALRPVEPPPHIPKL